MNLIHITSQRPKVLLDTAIGGYFPLELPIYSVPWLERAYKLNSARSAFSYILTSLEIETVWVPYYLCNSMLEWLRDKNVKVNFYRLNESFEIKDLIQLPERSILLYVNYFGLCARQARETIDQYGSENVVIDNSQAFYSDSFDTLATIFSPRKFFGLPDGGLLYSDDPRIKQPDSRDDSSESRMEHLIRRLIKSPENAYEKYLEAEKSIAEMPVFGMSKLTERLLHSVDYEAARSTRIRNACYLHKRLGEFNQLHLYLDSETAPMCYPFLPNIETLGKSALIDNRVFVPTYWPEVLTRVVEGSFEWNLAANCLCLPCDHRYTETNMENLINLLAIR